MISLPITSKGKPMNTRTSPIFVMLFAMLLTSCNVLDYRNTKVITPSEVIISEVRDVSGFDSVEFSTFGKLNILPGDTESLNISGPDNLVPEIATTVQNGKLTIRNKENFSVTNLNSGNILTFTLVVKNLTSFTTSGFGDVQIEALTTPSMVITMSGAGHLMQNQISTDKLNVTISGLGGIEITGQARQASIELSGAGGVVAPDLKVQNANVTLSGLGGATIWVTDQLTGNISGAGSVTYYGNPQTNLQTNSLGKFISLGNK
jgi:hypothetical protein